MPDNYHVGKNYSTDEGNRMVIGGVLELKEGGKLEERLKARVCELCGSTDAEQYEIHHIHKVKDLKGKSDWERNMIAKRRKTMVVCKECHNKIHGYNVSK